MVYEAEVDLPGDIRHDSPRVAAYVEVDNEKACQDAIDLLDVGYRVPAKPLKFELWGAHEDLLPTETRPQPRRDF